MHIKNFDDDIFFIKPHFVLTDKNGHFRSLLRKMSNIMMDSKKSQLAKIV